MTTLTNSEGKALTYTNEFIETILLQLNSSNNYYTTGDDDVIFIKIGVNKLLILDYTYHINRNIFQNYIINENINNEYELEFVLKNTSNEYTLQGVYTANSYIGTINTLQDVYLALYDTGGLPPNTYTGSENIDITDNQISLKFPIKINGETVFHPRNYGGAVFEMLSGTDMFAFRQNSIHGGQPIAIFYSQTRECHFLGNLQIPNYYNSSTINSLFNNVYDKTYIDSLISNYYDETYIDSLDNELSNMILNTYTKSEIDTFLTNYYDITYLNNQFDSKANISTTYNKTEVDNLLLSLDFTNVFYQKEQVDTLLSLKQDMLIDKSIEFSLLYNGKYLQSVLPGNNITMSYVLTADANVRNIAISADLNNYYDKTYLDNLFTSLATLTYLHEKYSNSVETAAVYYNKTEIDTILQSYYTATYVNATIYDSGEIDNMLLSYRTGSYIDANYYRKTEVDNILNGFLAVSYETTNSLTANFSFQYNGFNGGLRIQNKIGRAHV